MALVGGYFRRGAGNNIKQLSERAEILEERLTEVEFQRIASRDGFYDA